jgi:hypothetical protein
MNSQSVTIDWKVSFIFLLAPFTLLFPHLWPQLNKKQQQQQDSDPPWETPSALA